MADVVRELAAKLSLQVDKPSFATGDRALAGVKSQAEGLGSQFAGLAKRALALVAIGEIASRAKEAFVDFNSNVEQSTISLAAVQKMFKGGTWADSMQTATQLFEHYQQVAKASVGETQDFIDMHKSIAASAYQAGANLEDLKEITKGAVIASASMGESAIVSAMDVRQALTKGVSVRDRFMVNLLASEKLTTEKFNAMSKKDRVATLKKLLTSDWIKDASKQMESSYEGQMSTLRDTLKIAFGKVGQDFFKDKIESLKKINEWITKNEQSFNEWMGKVKTALNFFSAAIKGLITVGGALIAPFLKVLDVMQEIEDYGEYMAGRASARGLKEAQAQGPEVLDEYIRVKYYGAKPSKAEKPLPAGPMGLGADMDAVGKAGAGIVQANQQGKLFDYLTAGLNFNVQNLMMGMPVGWSPTRAQSVLGNMQPTPGGRQSATGAYVDPNANVSTPAGGSRFVPPEYASWLTGAPMVSAPANAEPVKLQGKMDVRVRVDVPDGSKVMSEDHQTELRAVGALYSE
jgi:hypothetical protein